RLFLVRTLRAQPQSQRVKTDEAGASLWSNCEASASIVVILGSVQALWTFTAGDHDVVFLEVQPNEAGHLVLRFCDQRLRHVISEIENGELPSGFYYAHVPALGLAFTECALRPRRQVNRRDHAARTSAAKLNRREFKRDEPRRAAQSFALVLRQCVTGATGKHQQFLSTLIV